MADAECRMRFCDNQKIESGNYTVSSESGSQPFTNALDTRRSKLFDADAKVWDVVVDITFPDRINSLTIFGPLGEQLGISSEAIVKLQADNVNDFTAPELDITIEVTSDQQLVYFISDSIDAEYRFWKISIDDSNRSDNINFGYLYLGDYTVTNFRNVNNGFNWVHTDPTTVKKSLDGTPYFDIKTEFDRFTSLNYALVAEADWSILHDLYLRTGKYSPLPVAIDPSGIISSDLNELTRLARFSSNMSTSHVVKDRYNVNFSMEEVI